MISDIILFLGFSIVSTLLAFVIFEQVIHPLIIRQLKKEQEPLK